MWKEVVSYIIVGAFWGCTTPLLRHGSMAAKDQSQQRHEGNSNKNVLKQALSSFLHVEVWLPFLLNQSGSLVFYVLLASSELSVAAPACNALALVFSLATSTFLGERLHNPIQTILGASLIVVGVATCVASTTSDDIVEETKV